LVIDVEVPAATDADGALRARAQGFTDYALRQAARAAAGQGATRPVLAELLRPTSGALALTSQTHTPVGELGSDFEWTARASWAGLETPLAAGTRLVRPPFWLPSEWDHALHARRSGLLLGYGYPLALEEHVHLALPPGSVEVVLPPPQASETAPLRYALTWARETTDRIEARLTVELASGELDAEGAQSFQTQLRSLLAAAAAGATYKR
jgi:hypothetical protein